LAGRCGRLDSGGSGRDLSTGQNTSGFMRSALGALQGRARASKTGRMVRPALSRTFSAANGFRRNPGLRVACPGLCCFVPSGH
jgi:hypothetical protein